MAHTDENAGEAERSGRGELELSSGRIGGKEAGSLRARGTISSKLRRCKTRNSDLLNRTAHPVAAL